MQSRLGWFGPLSLSVASLLALGCPLYAQSVVLPAPRLLTIHPMGARVGTTVDVTIGGEYLDDPEALLFSDPRITAKPKLDPQGQPVAGVQRISVAPDCPPGLYGRFTARGGGGQTESVSGHRLEARHPLGVQWPGR